ncbi:MAG: MFS transporter [Nocardioides sp.]|nr:MFS transporter [Nocardioides sp.]
MYLSLSDRPTTDAPQQSRLRGVSRIVITLGMVSLLTDISSESASAILPLYLTGVLGLSPIAYGFVDGLYQGVSALVRIAAGWAADRTDRPMPVAFSGYALSLVARVLMLVTTGFAGISAVVSLDRIGKGIRTAPRDAMIAASSPPERLGRAFGVHRTLDTVGAAIGPLMAFVILWLIPGGYHTVLVASLGFSMLGVAALGLFVPVRTGGRARRDRGRSGLDKLDHRGRRWREVATPGLVRTTAVAGVLGLLTVGDGFIYLALLDRGGFAAHWFPVMYVGTNIAYLSLAVPLGRLADRIGRIRVLLLGHVPLAAAYVCAVYGHGAVGVIVALALLGVFYAATDGVLAAVSGRLVPERARSTSIATAQTAVAIARLIASTAFGLLWYAVGPAHAMAGVAVALAVAVPAGFAVLRNTEAPSR